MVTCCCSFSPSSSSPPKAPPPPPNWLFQSPQIHRRLRKLRDHHHPQNYCDLRRNC